MSDAVRLAGIGDIVDAAGTAAQPLYTARIVKPDGREQTFPNVRPSSWYWDDLLVDEDAAKTVQRPNGRKTMVRAYLQGQNWLFDFVPAPLVGTCTGTGTEAIGVLLGRIAELEARIARLEGA